MKVVNVHEGKTQLSRILREVENGEEYVIARAGKAIARLVPIGSTTQKPRPGKWTGVVTIHDDFDAEDKRLESLFEGSDE